MNKDIEKIIKIQGAINKRKYHLFIETDLDKKYRWVLFLYNPNTKDYFSEYNIPILTSRVDDLEYLFSYLQKHDGFDQNYL